MFIDMFLASFLPNIEINLLIRLLHLPPLFSSLVRFDGPNHFQPWAAHERQQALAVIGCWKNKWKRGQKIGKRIWKERGGGQGRNGDWMSGEMRSRSSSFPSQGLVLSLAWPFVLLPNYFPSARSVSSRPLPSLLCCHISLLYPQCLNSLATERWNLMLRLQNA